MNGQLTLPFPLRVRSRYENYVAGANGRVVARLTSPRESFECLWLFGAGGVGKTHLLQAVCHADAGSAYIPAAQVPAREVALAGYGRFDGVLVDDVERWIGHRAAEAELHGIYNELLRRNARLILTAGRPPREVRFALPDLATRMRAAECYELESLSDDDKLPLLVNAADDRGIRLAPEVVRYLLTYVSRDQRVLLDVLDRLDRASLQASRRLTIPFVKEVLAREGGEPERGEPESGA